MATLSQLTGSEEGAVPQPSASSRLRKKLVRRASPDHSQLWRRGFQVAFLLLNIWIGTAFYLWVRGFETGSHLRSATRPAGVEGWLPIAGLMNFKYWLTTGRLPATHPAAMFLFITFVAIAFLLRKAFCSWLCPVGTLSEYLWRAGRQIFGRNFQLPRWLDIPLRSLKYVLLGFFVWAVANMSAVAVAEFMHSPYGAIADVRMLNFFRDLWRDRCNCARQLRDRVGLRAEFLVSLSVSLWSAARTRFPARVRCAFAARSRTASIARSAPRFVPQLCRSISWSRSNPQNAPAVSSALPSARQKARCTCRFRSGCTLLTKATFLHGQWHSRSQRCSSESSDTRRPPATGEVTYPTTSIDNSSRTRMKLTIRWNSRAAVLRNTA